MPESSSAAREFKAALVIWQTVDVVLHRGTDQVFRLLRRSFNPPHSMSAAAGVHEVDAQPRFKQEADASAAHCDGHV